jgi:GNAT superfamily N-acetyltransferase
MSRWAHSPATRGHTRNGTPASVRSACSRSASACSRRLMISIRAARPDEAAFLTQLCLRSKASWGYDEEFMATCRFETTLTPDMVATSCVVVAEVDARVTGMAQLIVRDSVAELDKLFVEPDSHRLGVGRVLLNWARAEASGAGTTALIVDADPYAAEFYRRCGAIDEGCFHPTFSLVGFSLD